MIRKGENKVPDYDDPELFDAINYVNLYEGATFGDLALLDSTAITSATIMTNRRCDFACMDKRNVFNLFPIVSVLEILGKAQARRNRLKTQDS